jgi:hypothetical protein
MQELTGDMLLHHQIGGRDFVLDSRYKELK